MSSEGHKVDAENILIERLVTAKRVFVLTGAGLGVASGLGTFRGAGGYWNNVSVERLASFGGFTIDPELSWDWYNMRIEAYLAAEPNAGHTALAELERIVPFFTLATQNVDGLHIRAGSQNVLELHGDLRTIKCTLCKMRRPLDKPFDYDEVTKSGDGDDDTHKALYHLCPGSAFPGGMNVHASPGMWRPNVVWFGESLPEHTFNLAGQHAALADVIIVAGTSLQVYPVAGLTDPGRTRATIFEINPDSVTDGYSIHEGTETVLPRIVAAVKEQLLTKPLDNGKMMPDNSK